MLTVLAYGTYHYRARKRIPVRVDNPPLKLDLDGMVSGGAVAGDLTVGVRPSEQVDRVTLYVDGKPVSRDATPPYRLSWNTVDYREGDHTVLVYARDTHGHRAATTLPVVVANAPTFPSALTTRSWADGAGLGVVTPDS
jgi:hypothetical protein